MFYNTVKFLDELSQNNSKVWFDEHRKEYSEIRLEFETFVSEVLFEVAKFDESIRFLTVKDCIFRINRDVRFTKDKHPYKTNLGASFIHSGKNGSNPGYYFQIQPNGKIMVGGGWYILDAKQIAAVRKSILDNAETFRKIIGHTDFIKTYDSLDSSADLKTHPKGYSSDNENIDLLKHTNFIVFDNLELERFDKNSLKKVIIEHFTVLFPIVGWLRRV